MSPTWCTACREGGARRATRLSVRAGGRALRRVARRQRASTGRHRLVGIADLLTAVPPAARRLTAVHLDADSESAGEVLSFEQGGSCCEERCGANVGRCASA